jgi:regulator of ribonuclease activity A
MNFKTPDLCDRFPDDRHLQIAEPIFRAFGGKTSFAGRVTTLKVFEDNVLIRKTLEEKTEGGVLVVDGGGSHRCALLGGNLAKLAVDNGWQGIIVYGCIRDSVEVNALPIGVRALHTHPLKSHKRGSGDRDSLISFAGINFRTGYYVYADEDGIVVADDKLI